MICSVRESAKNTCFERPDAGKILPDKSENLEFPTSSELFLGNLPNPSENVPTALPNTSQDIPKITKTDPNTITKLPKSDLREPGIEPSTSRF